MKKENLKRAFEIQKELSSIESVKTFCDFALQNKESLKIKIEVETCVYGETLNYKELDAIKAIPLMHKLFSELREAYNNKVSELEKEIDSL